MILYRYPVDGGVDDDDDDEDEEDDDKETACRTILERTDVCTCSFRANAGPKLGPLYDRYFK